MYKGVYEGVYKGVSGNQKTSNLKPSLDCEHKRIFITLWLITINVLLSMTLYNSPTSLVTIDFRPISD